MTFILVGILNAQAGPSGPTYWIVSVGDGSAEDSNIYTAVDESENVYFTVAAYSAIKVDTSGALLWQKSISGIGNNYGGAANDAYGLVQSGTNFGTFPGSPGGWDAALAMRDSSGTLQWQRYFGATTNDIGYKSALDSSGNVYLAGAGNGGGLLGKLTNLGVFSFGQTLLASSGRSVNFYDVAIASSGNIYVTGENNFTSGSLRIQVAKYNSSGTLQWQRYIGDGSSQIITKKVALDSSENVYVVGQTYYSTYGGSDGFIAKYNSSGTLQWQRQIGGSGNESFESVAVDSLGNVYAFGFSRSVNGSYDVQIVAKYNSSGTLQFQRYVDTGVDQGNVTGTVSVNDSMFMSGKMPDSLASTNAYAIKLPTDGSLTGTYSIDGQSVTYAASSLSAKTSSVSNGTSSQSTSGSGWSSGATGGTDATTTFTLQKTII